MKETFFGRWSRLKKSVKEVAQNPPVTPAAVVEELPSLESLTIDSDFTGFFRAKVDENLRRAALKKLLQDPRFNVMDGLDVYIDDYSIPDPIPEAMLEKLEHVRDILGKKEEPEQEPQTQLVETETPRLAEGVSTDDKQEKS